MEIQSSKKTLTLNVVTDSDGNPIAVSDASLGLSADTIFVGKNDDVAWQSLDGTVFSVEFNQGNGDPFGWPGSKKSGATVPGTVGPGHKGKTFKYSIVIAGKATLDPQIIIEK
jgi:hypothetical protein